MTERYASMIELYPERPNFKTWLKSGGWKLLDEHTTELSREVLALEDINFIDLLNMASRARTSRDMHHEIFEILNQLKVKCERIHSSSVASSVVLTFKTTLSSVVKIVRELYEIIDRYKKGNSTEPKISIRVDSFCYLLNMNTKENVIRCIKYYRSG